MGSSSSIGANPRREGRFSSRFFVWGVVGGLLGFVDCCSLGLREMGVVGGMRAGGGEWELVGWDRFVLCVLPRRPDLRVDLGFGLLLLTTRWFPTLDVTSAIPASRSRCFPPNSAARITESSSCECSSRSSPHP